ncbi:putative lipocalin R877 precursor [Moumouvirus goulette]|uniref:Putative lipocalin R877 n=1 Tax=Moumouvirus goulette TaxID=1247379 RepID=M1PB32_9VIRU|nr:putative lipocalin R877 precursor [Moumouvirus goulette]AGF85089.1 putative lipocalin R877 precursor [Moumouvirus goulette]
MWIIILIIILIILLIYYLMQNSEIKSIPYVNINKFLGIWYEIARLPAPFEQNCKNSRAIYSLKTTYPNLTINVINTCQVNNQQIAIQGTLIPAKNTQLITGTSILSPGEFMVNFGNSNSPYNINYVDETYQYAIVSSNRKKLWILSKNPQIDNNIYESLVSIANKLGFDINNLIKN